MLDVGTKKVSKNYRLSQASIDCLADLAEIYNTPVSHVLEAMVQQYGPRILDMERKKREGDMQ